MMKRLLFIIVIALFPVLAQEAHTQQEASLEEGLKYLKEGKYERAVIIFGQILKKYPADIKARDAFEEALARKIQELKGIKEEEPFSRREIEATKGGVRSETPGEVSVNEKPDTGVKETVVSEKPDTPLKETVTRDRGETQSPPLLPPLMRESLKEEELPLKPPAAEKKGPVEEGLKPPEDQEQFNLAQELYRRELYDQAITEYERLISDYPKSKLLDKATFGIAQCQFDNKAFDAAITTAGNLMDSYPKSSLLDDAQLLIGHSNYAKDDYEKARLEYLRLLDLYPASSLGIKAQMGVADSYRKLKDYRHALAEYHKVVKNYPRIPETEQALFNIGELYDRVYETRDYKKAVEAYGRLISEYPESKWGNKAKERKKYLEDNYL